MTHCYIAQIANAGVDDEHVVVKIGYSRNPATRFQCLVAMSWIGPNFIHATTKKGNTPGDQIERFLHAHLNSYRVHHEWFHLPREVLNQAKELVWDRYGETFELLDISDIDTETPEGMTA